MADLVCWMCFFGLCGCYSYPGRARQASHGFWKRAGGAWLQRAWRCVSRSRSSMPGIQEEIGLEPINAVSFSSGVWYSIRGSRVHAELNALCDWDPGADWLTVFVIDVIAIYFAVPRAQEGMARELKSVHFTLSMCRLIRKVARILPNHCRGMFLWPL